jgi:hypothetical protein
VAAVAGPGLRDNEIQMSKKLRQATVSTRANTGPVRVRLQRLNCNEAKPYPPDGVTREWWQRLKNCQAADFPR